jgi:hypothetical protein
VSACSRDDIWSEGQIRNELSVHDIPLDEVDAGHLEGLYLLAQAGEIGR